MSTGDYIFWAFVVIFILVVVVLGASAVSALIQQTNTPASTYAQNDFNYRNLLVQACLKNEQYSREECIILASGKQ